MHSRKYRAGALPPSWKGRRKAVPHFGLIPNEREYERMKFLMRLNGIGRGFEDHG